MWLASLCTPAACLHRCKPEPACRSTQQALSGCSVRMQQQQHSHRTCLLPAVPRAAIGWPCTTVVLATPSWQCPGPHYVCRQGQQPLLQNMLPKTRRSPRHLPGGHPPGCVVTRAAGNMFGTEGRLRAHPVGPYICSTSVPRPLRTARMRCMPNCNGPQRRLQGMQTQRLPRCPDEHPQCANSTWQRVRSASMWRCSPHKEGPDGYIHTPIRHCCSSSCRACTTCTAAQCACTGTPRPTLSVKLPSERAMLRNPVCSTPLPPVLASCATTKRLLSLQRKANPAGSVVCRDT
jgi:hypothetical protein